MMAKAPYSWVKRATKAQKREMDALVRAENEVVQRDWYNATKHSGKGPTHPFRLHYSRERRGDAWALVGRIDYVLPAYRAYYNIGDEFEVTALVRCNTCGGIRELADGQIEFCTTCGIDW